MKSRIINVRLDQEHIRKVRALREKGVVLSDLVREAIDEKYEALGEGGGRRDAAALVRSLFERYPDSAELPSREYDVHDAQEARAAVRRKLAGGSSQ
jgi:hypothetical protein